MDNNFEPLKINSILGADYVLIADYVINSKDQNKR